jgi:hypothetical protein
VHVAADGRALAIYLGALVLTAALGMVLALRLPPADA